MLCNSWEGQEKLYKNNYMGENLDLCFEISANHLKSKKEGCVLGTARIIHQGRSIHLWEIKITDESGKMISICKLTNMVLPKKVRNSK